MQDQKGPPALGSFPIPSDLLLKAWRHVGCESRWGDLLGTLPCIRDAALGHFLGGVRKGHHVPKGHQAKRPSFPLATLMGTTRILDEGNQFGVTG